MSNLKILTLTAAIALGACAPTGQNTVARLGTSPVLSGGTYSTGGGITVASELREINGKTGICGVWSESQSQVALTRNRARQVLGSGSVYLGREKLVTGLGFMRRTAPTTSHAGLPANCIATTRPWHTQDATRQPVLRLPKQEVYRDSGELGGQVITFRQTGPGALSGSLNLVETLFGDAVRLPLGQRPTLGGGRYTSGGGLSVTVDVRNIGGDTYVCGVWAETTVQSPRTEEQAPEILARGSVLAGGRTLISDLRFLRRVSPRRSLPGRVANCMQTGTPWSETSQAQPVTLDLPNHIVHSGPGRAIRFIPGRTGA